MLRNLCSNALLFTMSNNAAVARPPEVEPRHRMEIALEWAGISKQQMADHLGLNRHTVTNYLSGRSRPPRSTVIVWALRCGVPLEWIEHGTEPQDDPEDPRDTDRVIRRYVDRFAANNPERDDADQVVAA